MRKTPEMTCGDTRHDYKSFAYADVKVGVETCRTEWMKCPGMSSRKCVMITAAALCTVEGLLSTFQFQEIQL